MNDFVVESPTNGTLTIRKDKLKAKEFEVTCLEGDFQRLKGWMLEQHRLFIECSTNIAWDWRRCQYNLVKEGREALKELFELLHALVESEDDTASIDSFRTCSSGRRKSDYDRTEGASRRSSFSGSQRPSTVVDRTINPSSPPAT